MEKKNVTNKQGTFFYTRNDKSVEFFCERCGQDKKSKIIVKWKIINVEKTICNGCYGFLIQDENIK